MKKKGFTLIELLAVIVILAIIALIATPTILSVIEKARKGATEQSALGYIDAIEKQVAINQVKGENLITDGTHDVPVSDVTVKGETPTKGWVTIEKGIVTNYSFVIGKYVVTKDEKVEKGEEPATKPSGTVETTYTVYPNGTAIYYNPVTNTKCESGEAVSTTGTKTGCMKWYTFNDEGANSSTVNMILDHNTTATGAYNSTNVNAEPKEVATALTNDTQSWNSSLNARLITANEVAKITGNINFDASKTGQKWFYLDSNNQTQTATTQGASKYAWLFDYTDSCTSYGCNVAYSSNWGYWTNTPVAGSDSNVWFVDRCGDLRNGYAAANAGVRPVITISKNIIS